MTTPDYDDWTEGDPISQAVSDATAPLLARIAELEQKFENAGQMYAERMERIAQLERSVKSWEADAHIRAINQADWERKAHQAEARVAELEQTLRVGYDLTGDLIKRAEKAEGEHDAVRADRSLLERRIDALQAEVKRLNTRDRLRELELTRWREQWKEAVEEGEAQLQAHRAFVAAFREWQAAEGVGHLETAARRMMDSLKALDLDVHDETPEVRAIHNTP